MKALNSTVLLDEVMAPAPAAVRRAPMRVLHLLPSLEPRTGGVAEAVVQLVNHMTHFGCTSEVATLDSPDTPDFERIKGRVHKLGPGRGFYGLSVGLVRWLRAHASEYDALIVHGIWQFHSVAARLGLLGTRTPLFVFPHGMLDPWFQQTYRAKHLKKLLYWNLAERWVFGRAQAILFTCHTELELARSPFLNDSYPLKVTGFGIDAVPPDAMHATALFWQTFPELLGRRVLLYFGRIHEKKGCDLLLAGFAAVAQHDATVQLVMAGPAAPALLEQLQQQAAALGIAERVVWTGMLTGRLKWAALQAAEVFVLPSHQENFGISVVEALASGTPVLISNRVNICHEVEVSGGGWVYADTLEGVTEALRRWVVQTTPAEREAMRSAALACFECYFRIQTAASQVVDAIQEARP